jgi:hypothetical protein
MKLDWLLGDAGVFTRTRVSYRSRTPDAYPKNGGPSHSAGLQLIHTQ